MNFFNEKGVHNTIDALMVYCTIITYAPTGGALTIENNSLYMAANNTQNYLVFEVYWMLYTVIIPTPIDLTLVAECLHATNYSIVGNTIIENYYGDTQEYTFNDEGFLTSHVWKEDGEMQYRLVLDTGGDAAIPFGNYFLIFAVISVLALVYLKKQKIK